jgi:hypothetical protein
MSQDEQPKPLKTTHFMRRVILYATLSLVFFLVGFIPMRLKSNECSASLSDSDRQLSLVTLQNTLASAVIDAQLGNYEPARQATSDFFTSLRAETDSGNASVLSQVQRDGVQPLFNQRDEIITLLARNDPAATDRLSNLYVSYRNIMNK